MKLLKYFMEKPLQLMLSLPPKILLLGGLGANLPEIKIKINEFKKGINILDLILKNNILFQRVRLEEL